MVWPRRKTDQHDHRNVRINDHQLRNYCSNEITTAKYNFFTFIPIFLFEQFRRYENIFFLVIAIFQQIPNVSPTGRFTTAVPLFIILLVSALKEIFEDFQRHNADKTTNNSKILVLRNGSFVELEWKHVLVGDIIKIENGHGVPADTIILASSEPDAMCYIETSNLDGETNLKLKQGLTTTAEFTSTQMISSIKGTVSCKAPSRDLNEFTGTLQIDGGELTPLNMAQLLVRGSSLRNTMWVYGLVIFTGKESKVMLNSSKAPLKRSQVDRVTNKFILVVFGLLLLLTVLNTAFNIAWRLRYDEGALWYLPESVNSRAWYSYILLYITTLLLYNNMVPISLKVTLEMIRMIQAMYIKWDKEMHDEESDTPALARTSNLNEELGQVKYIFSDKTGTLTKNIMVFQACSIAGVCYGDDEKVVNAMNDEKLKKRINARDQSVHKFFEMCSVCHTVVPEYDSKTKELEYQASSPDERALVLAAKELDYLFEARSPKGVTIRILGEKKNYEILNLLKFTSTRKRMSLILRDPNNKLLLFCKGADNVIFERLERTEKYKAETTLHLEQFARKGLRTLCFAWCEIDERFYDQWKVRYHQASTALDDRDEKLSQVAEEIEKNMHLVGCSAIEDRLQDGVPETISHLARAGINLWVLTGDKQETAINIGYSCQLLNNDIGNIVINGDKLEEVEKALAQIIEDLGPRVGQQNQYALIIDGPTLDLAFHSSCKENFLMSALSCKVVICCRVSPWQKAEIVRLVKAKVNDAITLAIGDGANDVEMIQAAHVGVGISGREGLQAACASDYAIGQFRFLEKLLLVHGAWNYSRLTKVILYSFYKNICLFIMQFWFAFLNGYSGQVIIERWSLSSYNLIFTSIPPLVMGLFDRNVAMKTCLKYPELYKETLNSASFNTKTFVLWILNAIYHSAILFWIPTFAFYRENVYSDGKTCDFFVLGHSIFTYVVVTVCLKAGLEHTAWTYLSHIAIWGSILSWILFLVIYSYIFPTINIGADMSGMDYAMFRTPLFWVGLFTLPLLCLTRDITWKVLKRSMLQNLRERVMQMETDHEDPGRIIPTEDTKIKFRGIQFRKSNIFRILRTRGVDQQPENSSGTNQDENHHRDVNRLSESYVPSQARMELMVEITNGFAFSQEENGGVSQGRLIRAYNTEKPKPTGN